MKKKLYKSGSGWALFLPKPIIELLKIDPENDFLEIEIEKNTLTAKKAESEEHKK
jgi:hypothetical protein